MSLYSYNKKQQTDSETNVIEMDDKRVPKQDMSQNSFYSEKSCEALSKISIIYTEISNFYLPLNSFNTNSETSISSIMFVLVLFQKII